MKLEKQETLICAYSKIINDANAPVESNRMPFLNHAYAILLEKKSILSCLNFLSYIYTYILNYVLITVQPNHNVI